MRKAMLNLIVDAAAFVILAGIIATGLLIKYQLPPGSGGGEGRGYGAIHGTALSIWGLTRHQWGDIHFILALVLVALMAFHLVNHWQWIRAMAKGEGSPSGALRKGLILFAAGMSIIIVLLPFLLTPRKESIAPSASARDRAASPAPAGSEIQEGGGAELIYGSLTIGEVAQRTGLSSKRIATILGVKAQLREDDRLGRILRGEGLSMKEARSRLLSEMTVPPDGAPQK